MNPIVVEGVAIPQTVDEIRQLVREQRSAISIGGGRYSMGGQIVTEQSFFIDMRAMNRILAVSPEERTITIKVVLADGQLVEASRSKNLELF